MTDDEAAELGERMLPGALLERIRGRAAGHDRANTFPHDDVADLAASGYLAMLVPHDLGGGGLSLAEASVLQQRLAAAAPATALAVNMHLIWTGVAAVLAARGDDSLGFVQQDAADGELFAFGISEAGNDLVLLGSHTDARPLEDGGYAFTGTKVFTTLSPAWTRLGVHGLDTTSPDAPQLVFAFLDRQPGITDRGDWDALGMRATQSHTTDLRGATAPAERIVRRLAPGPNPDLLIFGIFAVFELLIAAVYLGLARRALDLAVDAATRRTSQRTGLPSAHDPDIRWRIADMALAYDGVALELKTLTADVDGLVDHGGRWFSLLAGVKHRAVVTAKRIVEDAMQVAGGASFAAGSELSRLSRDVVAGAFHPSDPESVHAAVATAWLGPLDPVEPPQSAGRAETAAVVEPAVTSSAGRAETVDVVEPAVTS